MKKKLDSRLLIIIGTVIAQIGLGTIYTWSLFNQPIADEFGWDFNKISVTFSITSISLAFSTLFAGKIQEKIGIKKLTIVSGIVLGISLLLASKIDSVVMLYVTAGIILGAADGIAYLSILSNCIKWFPEKKGLISGISVGAYGTGSLIFKYINGYMINSKGVSSAFFYWGILAMILIVVGGKFLKDAPEIQEETSGTSGDKEFTVLEMLKTKEAYLLFLVFITACMSGLYVIGIVKDIGVDLVGLTPLVAANAVAMVAIFNTMGRIVLGSLSDKIGQLKVVMYALVITAVSVIVLSFVQLNLITFFVCVAAIAFCFGGCITVFPGIVGDFFGINNETNNYGIIYQGFGVGSLLGTFIATLTGGFKPTFIAIAILCLVSIIIIATINAPHQHLAKSAFNNRIILEK